ncbi:MAG: hypothetical protein IJT67_02210 [Lachnospiraceae bacterium]|nr:hypothetical protein [Lachnospiraceae bacterium]
MVLSSNAIIVFAEENNFIDDYKETEGNKVDNYAVYESEEAEIIYEEETIVGSSSILHDEEEL